jgi:hypothetical protein
VRKQRVGTQRVRHSLGTQYANSSFSVGSWGGAAVATEAYEVYARRTERRDGYPRGGGAVGGVAEGSYGQQEAVVVEEDEGMWNERTNEGWRSG